MSESRKKNTIRNFVFSIASYVINIILSFITRTFFIQCLSTEYLGVSGLFSNILSLLSIAELGAGGAFVSLLYKPLRNKDEEKLSMIMAAFKKTYLFIALFIGMVGIVLTPFLDVLIKENSIQNIKIIYLMYIANSVVAYICASEKSLIAADQRAYIVTTITQIASIVQYIGQILILLLTHNYILFLLVQIVCSLIGNLFVSIYAKEKYIFLSKKTNRLDLSTRKNVIEKIRGGFCVHTGYIIASGTDSIIISYFLGLSVLGIYSNYLLIIGILNKLVMMLFDSVRASASNFVVSNNSIDNYDFFKKFNFLSVIIEGFTMTCLVALINPFIKVWIGSKYLMSMDLVVLATVINCVGWFGIKQPMKIFRDSYGLYYKDRYVALLEGFLNIALSIILVKHIGLSGVFLGTIFSSLCTWVSGSYLIFKYIFKKPVWYYWRSMLTYIVALIPVGIVAYYFVNMFSISNWLGLVIVSILCCIVVISLYCIVFIRKEEFKYYTSTINSMIKRGNSNKLN